jgi:hypothetical protein
VKKVKPIKPRPTSKAWEIGDKKIEYEFAWLPTQINDDVVWLEKYEIHYEFMKRKFKYELPYLGMCRDDGKPVYASQMRLKTKPIEYETETILMWVETKRQIKNGKK